jgi:hypothetical protein
MRAKEGRTGRDRIHDMASSLEILHSLSAMHIECLPLQRVQTLLSMRLATTATHLTNQSVQQFLI